ncbi:tRNA pseudouridine synthase 1 [Coccidioides immitis H538.4]|uniref:tRNA pseudouridine synthase 1 n=2 Tax=Coccidioides immitis TaxID=5501 RepID=A0A0J8RL94_COCIT|nr:tRNA pseudouridine synthase 1 [Coccidioides immitis RMSCC 2394]KMU85406.1 tRNA pseudouridine synthase 1 [Coccidioides immitis H538.4]
MDAPTSVPAVPASQDQSTQGSPSTLPTTAPDTPSPSISDNPKPQSDSTTTGEDRRNKRKDLGRKAWSRQPLDRRRRNEEQAAKRRKAEDGEDIPIYATQFSKEDIEADKRRPKRKVAVLLGYSGTGYHGMQMSAKEKTIEGEIFPALVAAGAISKANAMDPKKSSFVRCARTDKGVHAAGNVISLKLIIEDPDLVNKVNNILSPQIRIWGIEPTNKGFSCYQFCDSRIYEYLIPTHCFLPPHPSTFLAKKLLEAAEKEGDIGDYKKRQEEVLSYWEDVDHEYIRPILSTLPESTRLKVQESLCIKDRSQSIQNAEGKEELDCSSDINAVKDEKEGGNLTPGNSDSEDQKINEVIKTVRAAYFKAKKAYRIHPARLARVQEVLDLYIGTRNFHNYTIQKTFRDASARRVIKSFNISKDPIIIDGTEWLSLKVHGQSFMMHQIRKMVAMAALVVRCGTDPQRITQSYGPQKIPIPKAPGLGLLLERPIFDTYNKKATNELDKNPIEFGKYEKEIEEFKNREIYQRIFREEEETNAFGNFFNHIDTFREDSFLYVTSSGIPVAPEGATPSTTETGKDKEALAEVESESEDEVVNGGEEGG